MFLISVISLAVSIYIWIIIADVALFWLANFNIINMQNEQAKNLVQLIRKATEPLFKRIRKYVPPIGGIDLTPIIAIIGLKLIESALISLIISAYN